MAQRGSQLDSDKFFCSICLDLLKDPQTVPRGHSYCSSCIKEHWNEEKIKGIYSCPQCRKEFTQRPDLEKNILIAELVEDLKKTELQAAAADLCSAGPEDVSCDVCSGGKLKAVKSCLVCLVSYCEEHLQPHHQSPAFKKHQLVEPSKKLQEKICSLHDEVMKIFCRTDQQSICYLCTMDQHRGHETVPAAAERRQKQKELEESRLNIQRRIQEREKEVKLLQQEISELKRKDVQLEQLAHTEDHTQFLISYPSVSALSEPTHSSSIQTAPLRYFEDVAAAVSESRDTGTKTSVRTAEEELLLLQPQPKTRAEFLQYSQQITLDPDSVHRFMLLSDSNRKVTFTSEKQPYPDHPDRFTEDLQVLSRESLTGRHYFEVEWRGEGVFVAVSYKNISRAGRRNECVFGSNEKSWALLYDKHLSFRNKNVYSSVSHDAWCLVHRGNNSASQSSRVGVYLDHRAGVLSFYIVSDKMTYASGVETTFTQPLHAGIGFCFANEGNSAETLKPQ
ncbi:tripartite motif-containing protein 16-like [Salarias fasciatus]|uniref:tripartite motif-containing protein 16-like n=1 Tax=Salarias fasciatus TaxID=181472 RepID=UPI001176CD7D|nr:tripartite motif-containing protein 16-like [Salarias fasciatus]XP_029938430.1 tripartite motif-containing protein 16-like [Salarias fasciatus]XP_029938435.1 tripartite motif-containing protein 16-like [Salarias fasciatus]XP_029938441.1 tripartite motif-containing protein 16-like [Salarias fasciatus]